MPTGSSSRTPPSPGVREPLEAWPGPGCAASDLAAEPSRPKNCRRTPRAQAKRERPAARPRASESTPHHSPPRRARPSDRGRAVRRACPMRNRPGAASALSAHVPEKAESRRVGLTNQRGAFVDLRLWAGAANQKGASARLAHPTFFRLFLSSPRRAAALSAGPVRVAGSRAALRVPDARARSPPTRVVGTWRTRPARKTRPRGRTLFSTSRTAATC